MQLAAARIEKRSAGVWAGTASPVLLLVTAVAGVTAVSGVFGLVGADSRWLAALGHTIATRQSIPDGVPFAAASTAHWPNVIVLAELSFHWLEASLGDRGLMLAQLTATAGALTLLARDSLARGATATATASALAIASVGTLPSLAIARVQLFSLVLFPGLLALLRSEARRPTRMVWLVVPLLALWSNLHGAALVGLAITGVYLGLARFREQPLTAVGVGLACLAAVCATPAGLRTITYYHGVLTNVAAERGVGLWGPLSLTSALDLVMIGAVVWLGARALRSPRVGLDAWELVAIVLLAGLTIKASRSGVWLLFFLVAPAARGLRPKRTWSALVPVLACLAPMTVAFAVGRGPLNDGAGPPLVARTVSLADGTPILAADSLAEQIALSGGRIWAGNPIDAFSRRDQLTYLDWLDGRPSGERALRPQIRVVLVRRHSATEHLMQRRPEFVSAGGDGNAAVYLRVR